MYLSPRCRRFGCRRVSSRSIRVAAALLWYSRGEISQSVGAAIAVLKFKDMYPYDVHDDDSLVDALWSMYGETISTRKFSREKADPIKGMSAFWRPFNPDERRKINGVLERS